MARPDRWVVGGVKLIRTEPGLYQVPNLSWTDLIQPGGKPSDRFLLYYTGYRRMAKNILRQIVGRYLDRDKTTLETIKRLKEETVKKRRYALTRSV